MGSQGLPIIGGMLGAAGALSEAQDKADSLDQEAQIQDKNAAMARQAGKDNAQRQQIVATQKIGGIQADYASSGITSDSGSVLDILRQSHTNAEMDRLEILHGANIKAVNAENRASAARFGASRTRSAGNFNAFSALFGGVAKAGMNYGGGSDSSNNDYSMDSSSGGSSTGDSYSSYSNYA